METSLAGRLILIAEDEPLIALDIAQAFESWGARTILAHTLEDSLRAVESPDLSAAILDHALSDGDTSTVCERMNERNIPFVTYSGFEQLSGACKKGTYVEKPASMSMLLATIQSMLERTCPGAATPIGGESATWDRGALSGGKRRELREAPPNTADRCGGGEDHRFRHGTTNLD